MPDVAHGVAPGASVRLSELDTAASGSFADRDAAQPALDAGLARLRDLNELLHVDGRHAVLLVLQGMDTSGKDGTVRHLSLGLSLLGAELTNFKQPVGDELKHDFLWRVHKRAPALGMIGIFNRSHYEDVLVPRVHELVPPATWRQRFEQINAFEKLLTNGGTTLVKCFLHISKAEQKRRLQARLDDRSKLWKFDPNDVGERVLWDSYATAYEDLLQRCSTHEAPWHIVPADHKWYRNYAVTELLVAALEGLDLQAPKATFDPATIRIP